MKNKKSNLLSLFLVLPLIAMAHPGHTHEVALLDRLEHTVVTLAPFVLGLALVFAVVHLVKKQIASIKAKNISTK